MVVRRLVALDALRAIAVVLVFGRHVIDATTGFSENAQLFLGTWYEVGWTGVDLFFVLSGFLVSGLLFHEYQKHGTIAPFRFLGRRGLKIYPGFYVLFVFTLLWRGSSVSLDRYLYEAFFIQNYFGHVWNHTWSLAVEEHFYLGLVLLLHRATRVRTGANPFRWFPIFTAAVCVVVLLLRILRYADNPTGKLLMPTHLRLDGLLFGALLSYAWSFHRDWLLALVQRWKWMIAIASIVLVLPPAFFPIKTSTFMNTIGLTTNYLGFAGWVLLAVVYGDSTPWLTRMLRPLARVGFYSYSIYLWHMPVNHLSRIYVTPRLGNPAAVAVYLVGSIVIGIITAKLIELPVLKLRDRWIPSRAAAT